MAEKQGADWINLFLENTHMITEIQIKTNKSNLRLFKNLVISHRDLDQKNVLWDDDNIPMIIDWEAAGYINPAVELLDAALYWSGGVIGPLNIASFCTVIKSYKESGGRITNEYTDVMYANITGKLGWLEYSMKRSLRIECKVDEEQKMGTEHVFDTINFIPNYVEMIPTLVKWLSIL